MFTSIRKARLVREHHFVSVVWAQHSTVSVLNPTHLKIRKRKLAGATTLDGDKRLRFDHQQRNCDICLYLCPLFQIICNRLIHQLLKHAMKSAKQNYRLQYVISVWNRASRASEAHSVINMHSLSVVTAPSAPCTVQV